MNKFITKLASLTLGLAMAAGVGVAVGNNVKEAIPVRAATAGSTYVEDAVVSAGGSISTGASDYYVLKSTDGYYYTGASGGWGNVSTSLSNAVLLTLSGSASGFTIYDTAANAYLTYTAKSFTTGATGTSLIVGTGSVSGTSYPCVQNGTTGVLKSNTGSSNKLRWYAGTSYATNMLPVQLIKVKTSGGGTTTYSLTYNANKPSGVTDNVDNMPSTNPVQNISSGTEYTLESSLPTLTGYICLGWGATASATSSDLITKITVNSNKNVYAVWQESSTPVAETVTFNAASDTGTSPLSKGGVSFACGNGVLNNGSEYRLYKNSVTTFSHLTSNIVKIEFTGVSGNPASGFANQTGWTTSGNNGTWTGKAQEVSFTASGAQVRATKIVVTLSNDPSISFATDSVDLLVGGTYTQTATTSNIGSNTVSYSSGTTGVATVDSSSGTVTAVAQGSSVITASVTVGSDTYTATYTVNVTSPSVSFTNPKTIVFMGGTVTNAASGVVGGATIGYSSATTSVATVDSSTGAITPVSEGTSVITASATVNNVVYSDNYTLTVRGSNTPYTVAEARTNAEATSYHAYVTGTIYNVGNYSSGNKTITYWISADGTGDTSAKDGLQIYNGKGLNGADFDSADDLSVGDVVVLVGNLKIYNDTIYELDSNSQIVSIVASKWKVTFDSNGGSEEPGLIKVNKNGNFKLPDPGSKAGYIFEGWSNDGGTTKYAVDATSPAITSDTEFVAYWRVDAVETVTLSEGTFKKNYSSSDTSWDWQNLSVSYESESGASGTATGLTLGNFTFSPATPSNVSSVSVYVTYQGVQSDPITITGISYTMGASTDTFSEIAGELVEGIVSYEARKGASATVPAVNGDEIRVYQGGGIFEVTAVKGYKLTSVTVGSSMATTVTVSIDGGAASADQAISAGGTKLVDSISASSVLFTCTGSDKNSRLYVNYLAVTYAVDETPYILPECGDSLVLSTASGTTTYNIEYAHIDSGATVTTILGKSGVVTASVTNWILSISVVAETDDSTTITLNVSTASYTINVSVVEADEYVKVTDLDYLYQGQKVLIGSTDGTYVLGPQTTSNRTAVSSAHAGSSVFIDSNSTAAILTVSIQEESDGTIHYAFYDSDSSSTGYLRAGYASSGNNLTVVSEKTSNGALFTISLSSSGVASIVSNGTSSDKTIIRYNESSGLFSAYNGGQKDVAIYAYYDDVTADNIVNAFVVRHMKMQSILTTNTGSTNECSDNWTDASAAYAKLNNANYYSWFVGHYSDAAQRLWWWAKANGHTLNMETGILSANKGIIYGLFGQNNTNTVAIIVVISMVSVTAIGGYFFLRKRKENI